MILRLGNLKAVRSHAGLVIAVLAMITLSAIRAHAQDIACPNRGSHSVIFNPSWVQRFPALARPRESLAP